MMSRSANTKAITPPKLAPPLQSTAASGMLPTEQTKEATAISGPSRGPMILARVGSPLANTVAQAEPGTQAARAPAMRRPMTRSSHRDVTSIMKYCETAVIPSRDSRRLSSGPWVTDMSMAAWPSMRPAAPCSAWARASPSSFRLRNSRSSTVSTTIMTTPPAHAAAAKRQPRITQSTIPNSMTRLVEANWKAMAARKSAPLRIIERAMAVAA